MYRENPVVSGIVEYRDSKNICRILFLYLRSVLFFVDSIFRQDLKSSGKEDHQQLIMLDDMLSILINPSKRTLACCWVTCHPYSGWAMQLMSLPCRGGAFSEREKMLY